MKWDSRVVLRSEGVRPDVGDLINTDKPLIVPVGELIRVLVTSEDVIHRWGNASLGVKLDAIPGRLSRGLFEVEFPGTFVGMCMELCGALHYLMPSVVEAVSLQQMLGWIWELEKSSPITISLAARHRETVDIVVESIEKFTGEFKKRAAEYITLKRDSLNMELQGSSQQGKKVIDCLNYSRSVYEKLTEEERLGADRKISEVLSDLGRAQAPSNLEDTSKKYKYELSLQEFIVLTNT